MAGDRRSSYPGAACARTTATARPGADAASRPFHAKLLLSRRPTRGYAHTCSHSAWENYSLLVLSNILMRCETERAPNFSMI